MESHLSLLYRPLRGLLTSLRPLSRGLRRTTHNEVGGDLDEKTTATSNDSDTFDVDMDEDSPAMYDSQAFPSLSMKENTFRQEMKNSQRAKNPPYVLVEGHRLIADSMAAGARLRTLLFTHRRLLKDLPFQDQSRVFFIHSRLLKKWSDVQTPSGLFALIYTPKEDDLLMRNKHSQLSLICDQVRDPTNLGVMIRTAAAFGLRRVIVTKNSVNAWSPKVIRGGMSGHFRVPIFCDVPWASVDDLLDDDTQVHTASQATPNGLSCSTCYHEADFSSERRPQALVVGHETAGVSASGLSLTARTGGLRLAIPMRTGMESLNVGTASAVILSEMCRQLHVSGAESTAAFHRS